MEIIAHYYIKKKREEIIIANEKISRTPWTKQRKDKTQRQNITKKVSDTNNT